MTHYPITPECVRWALGVQTSRRNGYKHPTTRFFMTSNVFLYLQEVINMHKLQLLGKLLLTKLFVLAVTRTLLRSLTTVSVILP